MLLGTFAAGFVHELTNPVGSIQASAHYALESSNNENRQRLLRAIAMDCVRCRRTIEALSKFMTSGVLEKRPTDLATLVQRCREMALMDGDALTMTVSIDPTARSVWCDPVAFEQVILNIFKNAVRAGDGRCSVEIEAHRSNDCIRITCKDGGPGIGRRHLRHIFEPFYSTWKQRGGMGLGLTIAQAIMEALGGSMQAVSRPGHGATFILDLPAEPASSKTRRAQQRRATPA